MRNLFKVLLLGAAVAATAPSLVACAKSQAAQSESKATPPLPDGVKEVKLARDRALELDNLALKMVAMQKEAQRQLAEALKPMLEKQRALLADLALPEDAQFQIDADNNRLLYKLAEKAPTPAAPAAQPTTPKLAAKAPPAK